VVIPCPNPAPIPVETVKDENLDYWPFEVNPAVLYSAWDKGTWNFMTAEIDPWEDTARDIRRGRSCAIESMFVNGTGQYDPYGRPIFGQLAGANLSPEAFNPVPVYQAYAEGQPGIVTVISDGLPVSIERGVLALEDFLANCLCGEAGMIHTTPSILDVVCGDMTYKEVVDYGDGLGPRTLHRTCARGNVVVAGGGYCNALGPWGCPAPAGTAWLYATSQVYLAYDNIISLPDRGNVADAAWTYSNDLLVMAEQPVAAFTNPCCLGAVLVEAPC
jgi:hypothetical protein